MRDIRLTDGSILEVNINFLTMKLMVDLKIQKLIDKINKKPNDDALRMDVTSKLIYVILRSNGKRIDEEEAMMLIPLDDDVIMDIVLEFQEKMEKFKKKQVNKGQIPKK